jgi:phosphoesterase RecJ-like protein
LSPELNTSVQQLGELIDAAEHILVLQPEKPDTDSLTSSLALEQILGDQGKQITMYCQDELPNYISYFEGADRVTEEFPNQFDLTILVDTGGPQQVARTLEKYQGRLTGLPFAIVDHHPNRSDLPFQTLDVVDRDSASTCELVLKMAKVLDYPINQTAANLMVPGILADTLNLSIQTVGADQFRAVAELIDLGANVYESHQAYRNTQAINPELLQLKGRLLGRLQLFEGGKIGLITVTPTELKQYAEIHDPSDLVIYDLLNAEGVQVAVVVRHYGGQSNKIKISTRAKLPVAAKACAEFGGGGHDRAAGCQINDTPVSEVVPKFVNILSKHIRDYEALQHTDTPDRTTQAA